MMLKKEFVCYIQVKGKVVSSHVETAENFLEMELK